MNDYKHWSDKCIRFYIIYNHTIYYKHDLTIGHNQERSFECTNSHNICTSNMVTQVQCALLVFSESACTKQIGNFVTKWLGARTCMMKKNNILVTLLIFGNFYFGYYSYGSGLGLRFRFYNKMSAHMERAPAAKPFPFFYCNGKPKNELACVQ